VEITLKHPSNLALEAFAADEGSAIVAHHVGDCLLCRAYVVELVVAAHASRAWQAAADSTPMHDVS
jgi:hypothetical protein